MKYKFLLFLTLIIFLIQGCLEEDRGTKLAEGLISYDIEYMDDSIDRVMVRFLPKKMIVKFKNNNTVNKIESVSGIVSFTHIQNFKDKSNITLVKLMNRKYQYVEELDEPSLFFNTLPGIKIKETEETKEIAGYKCKKAIISCKNDSFKPFYVYYTNDIKINSPNKHTPFKDMDGVLMEFQIELYDINMRLTATQVISKKIPSKEFEVPTGYEPINKRTMQEIINLAK